MSDDQVINFQRKREEARAADEAEFRKMGERGRDAYAYLIRLMKNTSEVGKIPIAQCVRSLLAVCKKTEIRKFVPLSAMLEKGLTEDEIRLLLRLLENEFLGQKPPA